MDEDGIAEEMFRPEKIAVVGASRKEGKTGHEIFENLFHGFEGEVVPVNPNAGEVDGVEAEDETPAGTDLIVVAVPGKIVPDVLEDAGEKDVSAAVIVSAGFSESGNIEREEKVRQIAEENDIEVLGPNVLGLINTENSMNASFASKTPEKGGISFMSQSGAFCTAILDYAKAEHIGFRHFVSLGNKACLNEVDFLEHWREDDTETVLGYTEGIENGREFMEKARQVSKQKPVVMIKSGRTEEGGEAASSHTGSIAGSYEAYQAAFKQSGIIEAESNRELLDFGRALSYQPLPRGGKVAIVTNAGGPGVVTADEVNEKRLELASFSPETIEELEEKLPGEAAVENPVDVIGDAGHNRYMDALNTIAKDENVDAVIVVLTPQANTEIDKTAKTVAKISEESEKPIMASFMGEKDVKSGIEILENRKVPDFEDPMDAVKTLKAMKRYREYRETEKTFREIEYDEDKAEEALENFSGFEDRHKLFDAYGFDLPLTELAKAPKDAPEAGESIGYPVVAKLESPDVTHKTDIGGIKTGLESRKEVEDAFRQIHDNLYHEQPDASMDGVIVQEELEGVEVAVGMKRDPQFGPVIMVGLGGIYVEVLEDVSFGVAPISEEHAEQMIDSLEASEVFKGARGGENILEPVRDAIIRLGELALNHDEIQEIDINPLIVKDGKAFAADIKILLSRQNK